MQQANLRRKLLRRYQRRPDLINENFSAMIDKLTIYDILETNQADNTVIGLNAVNALEANIYEHLLT